MIRENYQFFSSLYGGASPVNQINRLVRKPTTYTNEIATWLTINKNLPETSVVKFKLNT
jgi:hypothetical protein